MTPEEARDLLDGTTPAYEWWADIGGFDRIRRAGPIEWGATGNGLECTEADAWLIAAAPTLAAMIAGMREEWGVACEEVAGPTTFKHVEWADSAGQLLTHHTARLLAWEKVRAGYPNVRVVSRYVTEPEAADAVD